MMPPVCCLCGWTTQARSCVCAGWRDAIAHRDHQLHGHGAAQHIVASMNCMHLHIAHTCVMQPKVRASKCVHGLVCVCGIGRKLCGEPAVRMICCVCTAARMRTCVLAVCSCQSVAIAHTNVYAMRSNIVAAVCARLWCGVVGVLVLCGVSGKNVDVAGCSDLQAVWPHGGIGAIAWRAGWRAMGS